MEEQSNYLSFGGHTARDFMDAWHKGQGLLKSTLHFMRSNTQSDELSILEGQCCKSDQTLESLCRHRCH